MLSKIVHFANRFKRYEGTAFTEPLVTETICILVGDIHGRIDLLERLLTKTSLEASHNLVFLGDFIDRGDHSADVLHAIFELDKSDRVTCLMGNHEKMLIDFLDEPKRKGRLWLHNGGLQTLSSFGVGGVVESSGPDILQETAFKLSEIMGPDLIKWLRARPLHYQEGNLVCVHAALDPELPLSSQKPSTCLWGHPNFLKSSRRDGLWVAHGHTIVEEACVKNGRISVDTGACYTGRLTAAIVNQNSPIRFVDTK